MYQKAEPKKNCPKCYGRGFIGIDKKTRQRVPCKCIKLKLATFKEVDAEIRNPDSPFYSGLNLFLPLFRTPTWRDQVRWFFERLANRVRSFIKTKGEK